MSLINLHQFLREHSRAERVTVPALLDDWLLRTCHTGHEFTTLLTLLTSRAEVRVHEVPRLGIQLSARRPFDDLAACVSLFVQDQPADFGSRSPEYHRQRSA